MAINPYFYSNTNTNSVVNPFGNTYKNGSVNNLGSSLKNINSFMYRSKITNRNVVISLSPSIKWGVPVFGFKVRF